MRDYRKLRAFELADELVLSVYYATRSFPREEMFGLTSQLRRAAVSIPSNIVEGSARDSLADYLRFLNIAFSSAQEVGYQISLASKLGYLGKKDQEKLEPKTHELAKVLNGLISALKQKKNQ